MKEESEKKRKELFRGGGARVGPEREKEEGGGIGTKHFIQMFKVCKKTRMMMWGEERKKEERNKKSVAFHNKRRPLLHLHKAINPFPDAFFFFW